MSKLIFTIVLFFCVFSQAHMVISQDPVHAMTDLSALKALGFPILAQDQTLNLGYTVLTPKMQEELSRWNHARGQCAGFEVLPNSLQMTILAVNEFEKLKVRQQRELQYTLNKVSTVRLEYNENIQNAIQTATAKNLMETVNWLASYPNRYNKGSTPNVHVMDFETKLKEMVKTSTWPIQIDLISHTSTPQKSVRIRITGAERPNEVIVLGGHLDSINQSFTGNTKAPGADDNASGSANLLEALRVLLTQERPARTIEFYWYAGEESGLLGSAEIAREAKEQSKNIVAVLQLDMTLYPGEGAFVIGNVTDYTSAWLRDYLAEVNRLYLKVQLVEDQCGYACSDHASWYRQGYPTLLPFEATTATMNRAIHSANDIVSPKLNFEHSLVFTKLAIAMAMDLGNSQLKQPY